MTNRIFKLDETILHLPVADTDPMWYVKITDMDSGAQFGEFYIALTEEKPDFYCPLYLQELAGKTVMLSCEDDGVPDGLFDGIVTGGTIGEREDLYPDIYKEETRQQVHFSSRRGWLNDPNGLVYTDGTFHMCYQHNPFGPNHGGVNVSWGLAVSPDGVHFQEYPDAIRPRDALTLIASGSALVDENNISGFGKNAILAVYTALESAMKKGRTSVGTRGQMLAYSTDGGYTFHSAEQNPIIPVPAGESWRDPKILLLDDGSLCIAVYETYEGKNCVSFYSSADCLNWKFESRTMDLYECPDLFRMRVAETGEELWVLYGANGMYRVGKFENYAFTQIEESHHLDYGSATYAGQTWNCHPDRDGRYHIAWLRDPSLDWNYDAERNCGIPFSQSMTLVCRFTLHRTNEGYRLFRAPIDAVSALRKDAPETLTFSLDPQAKCGRLSMTETADISVDVPGDAEIEIDAKKPVSITVGREGFTYFPDENLLKFTSGKTYVLTSDGKMNVRVITDVRSVEFFIGGEISATYACLDRDKYIRIAGEEADVFCRLWKVNSIWNTDGF